MSSTLPKAASGFAVGMPGFIGSGLASGFVRKTHSRSNCVEKLPNAEDGYPQIRAQFP